MRKRAVGRPRKPVISRDKILTVALARIEREGLAAMTMNGLARELGVNPMALYHYFEDRDALLIAAGERVYRELTIPPPRAGTSPQDALRSLAVRYLEVLAGAGELLRYLTASERAARVPSELFAVHVHAALAPFALAEDVRDAAHDVFVDFVHGFALSVPRTGLTARLRERLRVELAIVCAGIASLAS